VGSIVGSALSHREESLEMSVLHAETAGNSKFAVPSGVVRSRQAATRAAIPTEKWRSCTEKWGCLMVAAQAGKRQAYEQLFRELDQWLRRYYARRLPPAAAEDARQNALLAIHIKRHAYLPSKPFGPWIAAIARNKWVDQIRDASHFSALSLDDEMPVGDLGDAVISTVAVENLLKQLKPAQAHVIRLVKLDGASIEDASSKTGQSASLVKINIHRGLKKLAALASDKVAATACG
jgi:RNA polymerase sigma factor (sigma-70 family)